MRRACIDTHALVGYLSEPKRLARSAKTSSAPRMPAEHPTATGHGGGSGSSPSCIGPAEEFCMRMHHVRVDGDEVHDAPLVPWRSDCDQYCTLIHDPTFDIDICQQNPTGVPASVTAPRANWCPGAFVLPLA